MTDEQIAQHMGWLSWPRVLDDSMARRVITLVAAAEAAERERCANVEDDQWVKDPRVSASVAIRALD